MFIFYFFPAAWALAVASHFGRKPSGKQKIKQAFDCASLEASWTVSAVMSKQWR